MTWWDHSPNLKPINLKTFTEFEKRPDGAKVQYTLQQTSKMGQALQLAKQSHQLPDITTAAGLDGLPLSSLVEGGWFQPLQLESEALARLKPNLYDGFHRIDGKLYTFPLFHTRTHSTALWFNTELAEKAGLDPAAPPRTFDDFRAAARKMQDASGGGNGWICNLGMTPRLGAQVDDLAESCGFLGAGGQLFRTGEFAYHDPAFLTAIEFLQSMAKDKLMAPGSNTMDDKEARARFATGRIGYYLDGPWCAGVINETLKAFSPKLGGTGLLTPDAGTKPAVYVPPTNGMYHITATAKDAALASKLLSMATTEEYYVGIAKGMARPPLDLKAIDKAGVLPAYKAVVDSFQTEAFLAPSRLLKNPAVSAVQAKSKPITPGLGEIVQGVFSGDVTDLKAELIKLSDAANKQQDANIAAATKAGAKVSRDDFVFPDWTPHVDYGPEKYK
ncbi:ABC transporter substrate-binding protein [Kribbella turkmenica]|uniref:ABC transporter substrate-binding protein n=1 Tax=Kribbella turkmenica TaxID=2530375 RepID=UPI00140506D6|nr:extracellular solute-binding protein [Kribbella turkmenica]